jgi:pimeloyl-ACP methyl ester carboxylesterase
MTPPFLSGLRAVLALVVLSSVLSPTRAAEVEDVKFLSHGVLLSGSMVLPDKRPAIAALVLVQGSGTDARMVGFARVLASDGLAVLTYDKRGIGRSGGVYWGVQPGQENIAAVNLNLLADDAVAAMDVLGKDGRLEGVPKGFVGFSQAGWIIPIAATKSPITKFIGLWSSPVCTVSEQLHFQSLAGNDANFWKSHTQEQVTEYMKSVRYRPDDVDPRSSLARLSIPGLWLYGATDNLVPVDYSIGRLDGLIRQGHNNFEHRIVPGYGHNLLDSPAYSLMVAWIKSTANKLLHSQ